MKTRNRLYSLDTCDGLIYAVTKDEKVVLRTENLEEAKALFASLEGTLPALVDGPTHSVEQDLFLADQIINELLV